MRLREHLQISKRAVRQCFLMDKRFTACLILDAVLSSAAGYIPVYFSAKVIDALYAGASALVIGVYVGLTVGLVFLVRLLCACLSSVKTATEEAIYRSENWMYSEKAMEMAYESIEAPETLRLRYRIAKESQTGYNQYYLHYGIGHIAEDVTKIAVSLGMTASFFALPSVPASWKLALTGGLVLTLVVSCLSTAKSRALEQRFWEAGVEFNVFSEQLQDYIENYGAGKDIRLYGMSGHLAEEYCKMNSRFYDMAVSNSYRQALWTVPVSVLEKGVQFGVYGVLIWGALEGSVTVGAIAKYVACVMLLIGAVVDLAASLQISFDNHHYLKRYFSYFDIPNPMYQGSLTVEKREDRDYQVEFRDVSFRYPNGDAYALRHVSLKFRVGEKLAIVGENGSGKTTFIKLLCRLYDPCEGEILLNGVNIQKYDYDEYQSVFSAVFQDFKLFPFKLGEVVASGRSFDRERVEECLEQAKFGGRYRELPQGADTYLYKDYQEDGIEISGGEAQKIALARALYKDAPFILLDEPTAALDPVSEYEVYSNFNRISGDRTVVYISHRLASCRFCDKIAVFHQGQILQTGTHRQLLADEEGKYFQLWNAQAQYYK